MLKKTHVINCILILAACMLVLTSCGKEEESYTDTGMAAIEELDYTGALEAFDSALEAGEMSASYCAGRAWSIWPSSDMMRP